MQVYTIYDNREKKFWKHKAKAFWISKGAAKNALVGQKAGWLSTSQVAVNYSEEELTQEYKTRKIGANTCNKTMSFVDQTRYRCLEFDLNKLKGIIV